MFAALRFGSRYLTKASIRRRYVLPGLSHACPITHRRRSRSSRWPLRPPDRWRIARFSSSIPRTSTRSGIQKSTAPCCTLGSSRSRSSRPRTGSGTRAVNRRKDCFARDGDQAGGRIPAPHAPGEKKAPAAFTAGALMARLRGAGVTFDAGSNYSSIKGLWRVQAQSGPCVELLSARSATPGAVIGDWPEERQGAGNPQCQGSSVQGPAALPTLRHARAATKRCRVLRHPPQRRPRAGQARRKERA
jgi:hypothetical protein